MSYPPPLKNLQQALKQAELEKKNKEAAKEHLMRLKYLFADRVLSSHISSPKLK